jgi:hypothetical protein
MHQANNAYSKEEDPFLRAANPIKKHLANGVGAYI